MADIETRLARRRACFAVLKAALGDALFDVPGGEAPLHNIIFVDRPTEAVDRLRARGIGAVRQYRTLAQHPAYSDLADRRYPNADYWTDHAVYLPFGMALIPEEMSRIASAVLDLRMPLLNRTSVEV
jgi:dTDP-4-amino-4,6-dideoxygalactose transaminase